MESAATDDTSGRDAGDGGRTAAQDSVESASGVTEVGSSGNALAAAEMARRPGGGGGLDDGGRLTVLEKNAVDGYYDPVEAEVTTVDDGKDAPASPVRLAASRFGCLLLGFLAGAAAAVLFLMRHDSSPVTTCTVVPT